MGSEISKKRRFVLSAFGYLAAWALGSVAVWWKNRGISLADQTASSGMFAFGDSVTFLAVASLVSIAPTIYLLGMIDPGSRFWRVTSKASLLVASSAWLAGLLWLLPLGTTLRGWQMAAPLRFFCAPLFLALYAPGAFQASDESKSRFRIASGIELSAAGLLVLFFVVHLLRS